MKTQLSPTTQRAVELLRRYKELEEDIYILAEELDWPNRTYNVDEGELELGDKSIALCNYLSTLVTTSMEIDIREQIMAKANTPSAKSEQSE